MQERTQHQQQHKAKTIDKPTCTTEEGAGAVALSPPESVLHRHSNSEEHVSDDPEFGLKNKLLSGLGDPFLQVQPAGWEEEPVSV